MHYRVKSGESLAHSVSCPVNGIEANEYHEQEVLVTIAHAPVQQHLDELDYYHAENKKETSDGTSRESLQETAVT